MTEPRRIPVVDLKAQLECIRPEIDEAVARVLDSTAFVFGEDVKELEREFAEFCGSTHACAVANGTDALHIALRAHGIGPGDEVVTVANTFIATGEAILLVGAKPVFVDVDADTYTMDPRRLEAAITPRTRLILPVHLYGHPADMTAIGEVAHRHGLPLLEDAAQAHGAEWRGRRAGALGHAACFSFYPTKNLGAYGDAGMVTSSDSEFLARVRQIANHGAGTHQYDNVVLGTNSRLDTLQAAILRVKLRHLERWTEERRSRATAYSRALEGVPGVTLPREREGARSAWHLYTIRTPRARRAPGALEGAGDRQRRPLPAAHPPAAVDGAGGRREWATCRSPSRSRARCCACRSTPSYRTRTWSGSRARCAPSSAPAIASHELGGPTTKLLDDAVEDLLLFGGDPVEAHAEDEAATVGGPVPADRGRQADVRRHAAHPHLDRDRRVVGGGFDVGVDARAGAAQVGEKARDAPVSLEITTRRHEGLDAGVLALLHPRLPGGRKSADAATTAAPRAQAREPRWHRPPAGPPPRVAPR